MPIRRRVLNESNTTLFEHVGVIPDEEFHAFYTSTFRDPSFDLSTNLLVDLRQADSNPRSRQALRLLADILASVGRTSSKAPTLAILAPSSLSFGLARMYESFSLLSHWRIKVFREMDAATEWLAAP